MKTIKNRLNTLEKTVSIHDKQKSVDLSNWTVPELKMMEHWLESNQSYPLPKELEALING
jgi:hypothetical protein